MEQYAKMIGEHYNYHNNNVINNVGEYVVDNENTDTNSAVFVSPNEVVVAMRGTDIQEQKSRNILGAIGTETATEIAQLPNIFSQKDSYAKLLNETNEKMKKLSNLYPNKKTIISGHSRSGKIAIDIGKQNNITTYAYNPASLPHDVGKGRMERLNKYLFDINPDYDADKINIFITGHPQERIKYQQTLGTLALAEMATGAGATPLLALGVANLPTDTRRTDIVSSFAGYGLENTILVEPKDIIMSGSANQFFENKTHHSIRNFFSGNNNAPLRETLHLQTETHDNTFIPLNPNYDYCRLNPNNPLCRRITNLEKSL
jgi:hypothetical protein